MRFASQYCSAQEIELFAIHWLKRGILIGKEISVLTSAAEAIGPMSDTWEWQIRVRRAGAGEYEDAEPQRDHRRPAELHEVVDVVVGGDHLRAMVGHVRLPPHAGTSVRFLLMKSR